MAMALNDQHQFQAINQIAEALSSCERRRLFYLCEAPETDDTVVCTKEMLKRKVMHPVTGHLLLGELMLQLRRFDILRKVFHTSRDEVERILSHRQVLPRFRVLMAHLSEEVTDEDLKSLKFLLNCTLSREKIEKAKSFLDVVIEIEKLEKVSSERVDLVEECLVNIGRLDLAKKVTAYKMSAAVPGQHESQQQRSTAARPFPNPNSSPPLQQMKHGQPIQCESMQVSVQRWQSCQNHIDYYKFNTTPRGVCVIIDCVGNDGELLEQTFKALHFQVVVYRWLSVDNTLSALRRTLTQRENLEGDAFVCCIISRGTATHLLGTDSCGIGVHLDSIRRLFAFDVCPALAGKPKLFFIQKYRIPEFQPFARIIHRDEDLETDDLDLVPRCDFIPEDADFLWSHCWTDECLLEQGHHCSVYLRALTDALHKGQRRKTHLIDVHTEVNGAIFDHNKRNPGTKYHIDLKHTLRKDLYLN